MKPGIPRASLAPLAEGTIQLRLAVESGVSVKG